LSSGKRVVLLSSTYQRTMKYLQCLASGIPCMSHMWLVNSCTQVRTTLYVSYVAGELLYTGTFNLVSLITYYSIQVCSSYEL